MAQDLNKVMLVCRLAADPELRSLASGTSVCSLRVAFNTSKKDASGNWQDVGNFMNVTVWGAQGERLAQTLTKGQRIGVEGRLEHRTWKAQDGSNREAHQITADRVQYLDPKPEGGAQRPASAPATAPATPAAQPTPDDDIPF